MKTLITTVAAISLLIGCSTTSAMTIRDDYGGVVIEYMTTIDKIGGQQVRIVGTCASACTMYLSAKNVCIGRNVKLMFHSAQPPTDISIADQNFSRNYFNNKLMESYPQFIRDYINKRGGLKNKWITMTYKDLKGKLPNCT